jgi:hypothetical protein
MSDQIPLHELNQHLFAALLPATHGEQAEAEPKARKPRAPKEQAEQAAAEQAPQE